MIDEAVQEFEDVIGQRVQSAIGQRGGMLSTLSNSIRNSMGGSHRPTSIDFNHPFIRDSSVGTTTLMEDEMPTKIKAKDMIK